QAENPQGTAGQNKKLMVRYLKFVKPYRFYLLVIVVLGLLQFAVPLTGPWLTKILIDDVLAVNGQSNSNWSLKQVVILVAIIYTVMVFVTFFGNNLIARLGNRMIAGIRRQVYEHIQRMSQRFYDSRQVGSILSRVISDVNGAQNLLGSNVINVVFDLIMVVFAAIFLFSLNTKLALISLWILPIYY